MKKRNVSRQKPDDKTSSGIMKKLRRLSRVQILVTATVITGIGLIWLVLRDDAPTLHDNAAPQERSTSVATGSRVVNEEKPVINGANRPPLITSVKLSPKVVIPGVPVRVEVNASDPDQDDLSLKYTWQVNGQVVEQTTEEFNTTDLRKGDLLTVSVIPDDGKEAGQSRDSNGILIQNRPPEITSMPSAGVSRGVFQYQVLAKDSDKELLQFSLEGAPPGMTIDPTGLIQWSVPKGLQGKQQVRVIVADGTDSSFQAFNLNLGQNN